MIYKGSCYCREIQYQFNLPSPDDARTSICHCNNCKKFTGGPFGVTTKIPRSSFEITQGKTREHVANNGSGTLLHREFCLNCGGAILEFGENAGDFVYIFHGTLDDPNALPPKGEFFCKFRSKWMPEIPNIFHKQEIKD